MQIEFCWHWSKNIHFCGTWFPVYYNMVSINIILPPHIKLRRPINKVKYPLKNWWTFSSLKLWHLGLEDTLELLPRPRAFGMQGSLSFIHKDGSCFEKSSQQCDLKARQHQNFQLNIKRKGQELNPEKLVLDYLNKLLGWLVIVHSQTIRRRYWEIIKITNWLISLLRKWLATVHSLKTHQRQSGSDQHFSTFLKPLLTHLLLSCVICSLGNTDL